MKANKLIEVAMPIKEISAESVRDKSIRHGHISTLHLWWARRPLPACRAIVFGSLVPDPDNESCPQAFRDAVEYLLKTDSHETKMLYKPYKDIPYTAITDPMDDTLRNRLIMFIGKFSDKCQDNMSNGKSTPPKEQLSDGSLIKWENKNNPKIIGKARELIFVAYNSDLDPGISFETLHREYVKLSTAITDAEEALYSTVNRHQQSAETERLEQALQEAINAFQNRMPSVFDPFAGGGAIPLEAARLGCRSYGNDINPVAHIIERGSAEFPQKYGKPITYTEDEFYRLYGERGRKMLQEHELHVLNGMVEIPNRLAWDVEFYAKQILEAAEAEVGYLYPKDEQGRKPVAYYWARTATCSNPTCRAEIPMLKQFYLVNTSSKKVYLEPIINGTNIDFEIKNGTCNHVGFMKQRECSITCPCCGAVLSGSEVKQQSYEHKTGLRLIAVIKEGQNGKEYFLPNDKEKSVCTLKYNEEAPTEMLPQNDSQNLKIPLWGFKSWGELFSDRQLKTLNELIKILKKTTSCFENSEYSKAIIAYLAIWIDKVLDYYNSFCTWHVARDTIGHLFSKQAIPMVFDYAETNVFSDSTGCLKNMCNWITRFLDSESSISFPATFANASSGDKQQFEDKSLTAVVTDPPYYDAIAYADLSDFFYVWLKRTLNETFPLMFSTPQTPKTEECTAIKHRYNGNIDEANTHFENKLTEIFDAIEQQTSDIVSIMFAHQSTRAWTTLCNSILSARMNITGSWPMDTEMANRSIGLAGAALESSVTVACRPNERKGFEEYRVVEQAIKNKVKDEVEKLYELGFRGADLLTACFGQAVSEFGKYKVVERADGHRVAVAELLELARQTAFDTLLSGVKADELTRFYLGWLQMNGMGETDHDDVTKFTRVGVNVDIQEVIQEGLLVSNGNKNHLASAEEHLKKSVVPGTLASHPLIDQVHRAILLNRDQHIKSLLKLIHDCAPSSDAQFWRVLAALKESLPACPDLKDVQELLRTAEYLRTESKKDYSQQPTLFDNIE